MYAVVRTGGRQYRVEEGALVTVPSLKGEPGSQVELGEVLLVADDGTPQDVARAKVTAEIVSHGKGEKIKVFRYKNKTRQRKTSGSRAGQTTLRVTRIEV